MNAEDNKVVVRRWFEELFNEGNLEVADELCAPEHVLRHLSFPEEHRGLQPVKYMVALLREVSPDLRVTIDDQIAEGDKVVTRWTASGTVQEEF